MKGLWIIAHREWLSFFLLPVGWVVIALYMLVTGVVFAEATLRPGEPASMRDFFGAAAALMIVVCPAISMRLISEELRTGTLECLMTSPLGDLSLTAGKYLGACLFLFSMLAPSLAYVITLWTIADPAPDPGPILAGYLSLALVGMTYLAIGILVSALTASQTLAFLGAFLILLLVLIGPELLLPRAPAWATSTLRTLSINQRVQDFAKGVIDVAHVAFFLSVSAWLVLLASLLLTSRRWR
ncbi:MAG: ABC transporter permease subunit [Phycisphaeraceae bacterium]|nr:ABC transporter permease subunit [Phycisphaeraceae bacterium]MCW5754021.1 ABC transporter permease subunit [Phycisphaeraceae bacterium]